MKLTNKQTTLIAQEVLKAINIRVDEILGNREDSTFLPNKLITMRKKLENLEEEKEELNIIIDNKKRSIIRYLEDSGVKAPSYRNGETHNSMVKQYIINRKNELLNQQGVRVPYLNEIEGKITLAALQDDNIGTEDFIDSIKKLFLPD